MPRTERTTASTNKVSRNGTNKGSLRASGTSKPSLDDEDKELNEYVRNGLKLRDELLVNHTAMEAAKQEYLIEYARKRH